MRAKSLGSVLSTNPSVFPKFTLQLNSMKTPPQRKITVGGGRGRIFGAHNHGMKDGKNCVNIRFIFKEVDPRDSSAIINE